MRSPDQDGYGWLTLPETPSTQSVATDFVKTDVPVGVVFALDQTAGRGRFGRTWVSTAGDSLTYSLIFRSYANHPRPHLVGMTVALAVAGALGCRLRWPNDLVFGTRKVGGILTEIVQDPRGRHIPVVGVGINLNQASFSPELADIATSLAVERAGHYQPETVGREILAGLAALPEPESWQALTPIWAGFDATPGKAFRLPTGEPATAVEVGPEGQLICTVDGQVRSILAAEAIFGT